MAATNIVARSGNRILVQFDGKVVGAIQSVSMHDDYSPDALSGIGDIHVHEYVPSMARHSINVEEMVLYKGSLRGVGIAPENGDAVLQGTVFDIVEVTKDDNTVMRKYIGCSYASGGVEIRKHQIVVASAVFMALDVIGTGA